MVLDLKDGNNTAPAAAALRWSISLRVKLDGMIDMAKLGSEKELVIRNWELGLALRLGAFARTYFRNQFLSAS